MAARKVKRKSKARASFDSAGRLRLAGRFASRAQVRAKRLRLPKPLTKKQLKVAAGLRSRQSSKSAQTRLFRSRGIYFNKEYRTPVLKYLKREYLLPANDPAPIRDAISMELKGRKRPTLMTLMVEGQQRDGTDVKIGTPFFNAQDDDSVEDMSGDLESKERGYNIVAVSGEYVLTFSFARQEGG